MNDINFDSLVSENYHLIHAFLGAHRYYGDAYYDAAVDGLLEAARRYCEYPELRELAFEAIAFRKMQDAVCRVAKKDSRRREIIQILHLEEPISGLNPLFCAEDLRDSSQDLEDDVTERLLLAEMLSFLTEKQIEVFHLKRSGYSYNEMARQCGIGYAGVSSRLHRMRDKLRKLKVTLEWA